MQDKALGGCEAAAAVGDTLADSDGQCSIVAGSSGWEQQLLKHSYAIDAGDTLEPA